MGLAYLLKIIALAEQVKDYELRNDSVIEAVNVARAVGLRAGFAIDRSHDDDPEFDGFRVVAYIELPTGQVSWHLPEHDRRWDGHTTEQKYARIEAYLKGVRHPVAL